MLPVNGHPLVNNNFLALVRTVTQEGVGASDYRHNQRLYQFYISESRGPSFMKDVMFG